MWIMFSEWVLFLVLTSLQQWYKNTVINRNKLKYVKTASSVLANLEKQEVSIQKQSLYVNNCCTTFRKSPLKLSSVSKLWRYSGFLLSWFYEPKYYYYSKHICIIFYDIFSFNFTFKKYFSFQIYWYAKMFYEFW